MKTMIEVHVLQNFAPSNLNRDDTGAPKDALFGGTRRARVSSQCLKRALREYFALRVDQGELAAGNLGLRTKRLLDEVTDLLVKKGRDQEPAKHRARLSLLAGSGTWVAPGDSDGDADEKSEYLMFLGNQEIVSVATVINDRWDAEKWDSLEGALKKASAKEKKKEASKKASKELKESFKRILNGGKAVDVALFGRMLADMPERNQNAACQVAHAISTHAVEREFDFYTAVDDLKPEDTAGADMMGTVEFNSACFYRYAVVDWPKLVENLQGDAELATRGLRVFLEGFVVAEPTGKQNTFAAHNQPKFVVSSVRRNTAPRSLANAFECAVRTGKSESLTKTSAQELAKEARLLQAAFGGEEQTFVLNLIDAEINGFGNAVGSLEQLLDKTVLAVQA